MQNSVNRRGFSALKRIRTWLQSSNRILNNTLMVSVLMEQSFKNLNLRAIWVAQKNRRITVTC